MIGLVIFVLVILVISVFLLLLLLRVWIGYYPTISNRQRSPPPYLVSVIGISIGGKPIDMGGAPGSAAAAANAIFLSSLFLFIIIIRSKGGREGIPQVGYLDETTTTTTLDEVINGNAPAVVTNGQTTGAVRTPPRAAARRTVLATAQRGDHDTSSSFTITSSTSSSSTTAISKSNGPSIVNGKQTSDTIDQKQFISSSRKRKRVDGSHGGTAVIVPVLQTWPPSTITGSTGCT
mmetsp:Transcript_14851/g.33131  ORF Transcript_14851/g.33131 Transcript_14851/m.33131 type:complete len:234 (+) Transcript_14851:2398-3099(+)